MSPRNFFSTFLSIFSNASQLCLFEVHSHLRPKLLEYRRSYSESRIVIPRHGQKKLGKFRDNASYISLYFIRNLYIE